MIAARPLIPSLVAAAVLSLPAIAGAEAPRPPVAPRPVGSAVSTSKGNPVRTARLQRSEARTCTRPAVEIAAGLDVSTFALTRCDGTPAPLAVDKLSILARPGTAAKPRQPVESLPKTRSADVAPGVRRVDPRLVERLDLAVEHFRKAGEPSKVQLISGVRPKSAGSYHQSGRALDFRIEGVSNEALVAFCKTLPDTGCGYYPNSLFVHMDVRDRGAGHVAWIDVSKPGEAPKYVSAWPLPKDDASKPQDDAPRALSLPALPSAGPREDEGRKTRGGKPYFF